MLVGAVWPGPACPRSRFGIPSSTLASGQQVDTVQTSTPRHTSQGESPYLPPLQDCRTSLAGNEAFLKLSIAHIAKDGRRLRASFFPDTLVVPSWQTGVPQGGSGLLAPLPRARLVVFPMWKSRLTTRIHSSFITSLQEQVAYTKFRGRLERGSRLWKGTWPCQDPLRHRVAWPTQTLSQNEYHSTSNAINHPTALFLEGWQIHWSTELTHQFGLWSHFPEIMKASRSG